MSIFNTKRMTGMTEKTVEHFVLGAGVFAKDFIPGTDTYESAKTAGKLLGATTGGGEFKAAKVGHYSQVDGAPENTKGLYILDYWTTTMQATVKELTADTIVEAMTAAKKTTEESVTGYDVIVPKSAIELDDYTENVTYIGRPRRQRKTDHHSDFQRFQHERPLDSAQGQRRGERSGHFRGPL